MLKYILLFFIFAFVLMAGDDGIWNVDETGEDGGTTDTICVKYGDSYGSDGWLNSGDTLYLDTLWRSEARVDTLHSAYIMSKVSAVSLQNGTAVTKSWQMNNLYAYGWTTLNSAGDYVIIPLDLMADSAYIDSIAWIYGWGGTPPDADTMYFIYSDSTDYSNSYPRYNFTIVDTVGASEINKNSYGELLIMTIDTGYNWGSFSMGTYYPLIGLEYEKETGSGAFYWTGIIVYWTAFNKR